MNRNFEKLLFSSKHKSKNSGQRKLAAIFLFSCQILNRTIVINIILPLADIFLSLKLVDFHAQPLFLH